MSSFADLTVGNLGQRQIWSQTVEVASVDDPGGGCDMWGPIVPDCFADPKLRSGPIPERCKMYLFLLSGQSFVTFQAW